MTAHLPGLAGPRFGALTPGLMAGPLRAAITAATRRPEPDAMAELLVQARQLPEQAAATQALPLRIARGLRERQADPSSSRRW